MPHLAEFNVARLAAPLDAPESAEFVRALEPINALADVSPGFIWRWTDERDKSDGYGTAAEFDDPLVIINFSIWTDLDSLKHYVTRSGHSSYLRRRRDWFERPTEATTACWWIDEGERPSVAEGVRRLTLLRAEGPTAEAWPMNHPFDASGNPTG